MCGLIDDIDECRVVIAEAIVRSGLTELVGSLVPDRQSLADMMMANEEEETEIDLVDEDGQIVASLFVDVLDDPVNRWRIGLRGWRLSEHTASV